MMSATITIAIEEWRYWSRTKLGAAARESMQVKAEQTFRDQPARHPHRMVHYGHYVFRTPTALAALDPGVDSYTGTVMFLEGHRQNTATFSPNYDGAQAGPFAQLTPALAYQLLVPLVLIVMGFSVVAREREAVTDRQLITSGISPVSIWFGKTLALIGVALLMLLPLLIGVILSDSLNSIGLGFFAIYALYLLTWVLIISAVSTWSRSTSASLLIMLTDGHNANDPAFNRLKANLFEQYGVERVEDLPVNFRGVVAQTNEAELTDIINEFAQERIAKQVGQTDFVKLFEFVSPFLILQSASMIAAGTDGKTHHRFLREAEAVRFEFVQNLNQAHAEKLSYAHDINRNKNEASSQRSRISAENWSVLNDFRFEADTAAKRLQLRCETEWFYLRF